METKESSIRLMTRLAVEHQAVNLAQGFTDEAPFYELVWGGIAALIGGTDDHLQAFEDLTLRQVLSQGGEAVGDFLDLSLKDLFARLQNPRDRFNQYSYPFGLPELRRAIADYTHRLYHFHPDPETEITVVLGATEGVSSVLRALCEPGDGVVVFQPFHEMYPAQAHIFGLQPRYITLRENPEQGKWDLVLCRRDSFTKSLDFREDGIGRSRPYERVRVGVPLGGIAFDALDALSYLAERVPPNRLARDDVEPNLHLVEPRSIGGGVVKVKSGAPRQPLFDLGMLVGGVMVNHEMHVETAGHVVLDVA